MRGSRTPCGALEAGYDCHLPKPVAPADLIRAIKSVTLEITNSRIAPVSEPRENGEKTVVIPQVPTSITATQVIAVILSLAAFESPVGCWRHCSGRPDGVALAPLGASPVAPDSAWIAAAVVVIAIAGASVSRRGSCLMKSRPSAGACQPGPRSAHRGAVRVAAAEPDPSAATGGHRAREDARDRRRPPTPRPSRWSKPSTCSAR